MVLNVLVIANVILTHGIFHSGKRCLCSRFRRRWVQFRRADITTCARRSRATTPVGAVGARKLGLSGSVGEEEFQALSRSESPEGSAWSATSKPGIPCLAPRSKPPRRQRLHLLGSQIRFHRLCCRACTGKIVWEKNGAIGRPRFAVDWFLNQTSKFGLQGQNSELAIVGAAGELALIFGKEMVVIPVDEAGFFGAQQAREHLEVRVVQAPGAIGIASQAFGSPRTHTRGTGLGTSRAYYLAGFGRSGRLTTARSR
jgi:hypothetical protein